MTRIARIKGLLHPRPSVASVVTFCGMRNGEPGMGENVHRSKRRQRRESRGTWNTRLRIADWGASTALIPALRAERLFYTAVPEDMRKWAGTFCVLLPHGRDE